MFEINFRCQCINDCYDFDLKRGMILGGIVTIDEDGSSTFTIIFPDGEVVKCVQDWFANYFKIIE